MAPRSENSNTTSSRNYKLCRVCNSRGKRGNPLVICTSCTKHVHSSHSCSSNVYANCSKVPDKDSNIQFKCNMCKVQKRMSSGSNVSTTQTVHTINSRRGSSQKTISFLNDQHIRKPATGNRAQHTTANNKSINELCNNSSHAHIQQQIDKIMSSVDELHLQLVNNNVLLNHLKQENIRPNGLVLNLQNENSTQNSATLIQQLPDSIPDQSIITDSRVNDNIYNNKQIINHQMTLMLILLIVTLI